MTDLPPFSDPRRWIVVAGCGERDLLHGNPHTFRGRMAAYCPHRNVGYAVSRNEIVDLSPEAEQWIEGFLSGNEPECPLGEDGMPVDEEDPRYVEWHRLIDSFRRTGAWPRRDLTAPPLTPTSGRSGNAYFVRDASGALAIVAPRSDTEYDLIVAHDYQGQSSGVMRLDRATAANLIEAILAMLKGSTDD